ncbi:MAG: hypothetical protein HY077_01660 [Elusimicrobia bacterium]|nr:hypothetical protein [Elusimicrobiota bacterium]
MPENAISPTTQGRGTALGDEGAAAVEIDIAAVETEGALAASDEIETIGAGADGTETVVFGLTAAGAGDRLVAVPEDKSGPVCACAREGESKTAAKSVLITSEFTPEAVYKKKTAGAIGPGGL